VTLLDIRLDTGKTFLHSLPPGWNGTIFVLSGAVGVDAA
jgi:redox-sensitive bicupin YhaK (pirin superfamily)